MIRIFFIAVAATLLSFTSSVNWKLDAVHSNLGFSVGHLGVSEITGTLQMNQAKIVAQGADLTDAAVTLEIDMKSIDTNNDKRDNHLRTPDFFDVEKYPTATFISTSCKKSGEGKYTLIGNFSLHGVIKPMTIELAVKEGVSPADDKPILGIKATTKLKRSEFNIATDTPDKILNDEVVITANLEFRHEKVN